MDKSKQLGEMNVLKLLMKFSIPAIVGMLVWIVTRLFPEQLVSMFNSEDAQLITFGTMTIKRFMIFLPLIGFQIVSSNYFQAVGKPKHSALLGLSRQVLILIPALIILPKFYELEGVISAGPLADIYSMVVTGIFIFIEMKKLDKHHESTIINDIEETEII
jgi:Na+-driven multidrug efflux pump